ncbi:DUF7344 domain-containing protein [Natrarchaeobius chitinivorans]|uniref:DUF7344 domain-containing protein n=1 Tax=Natrarchaeobius chitinivorans TaxID=1679083 RepID=A0A3N6LXQ7_NATCH|nr:hypothetical protein [Natrarchaeobius chitinivorans]RQG93777.1 hypothetical protein EA473_13715 [Natrarchaeobius chitinivorans]
MDDDLGPVGVLEEADTHLSVDELLRLLSVPATRLTIIYLYDHPDTTADQLAAIIAANDAVSEASMATESEYDRARTHLYHSTLPRLEDHGFLEFDPKAGTVAKRNVPEPIYTFLGVDTDE